MKLTVFVLAAGTILKRASTTGTDAAPPPRRQLAQGLPATPESQNDGGRALADPPAPSKSSRSRSADVAPVSDPDPAAQQEEPEEAQPEQTSVIRFFANIGQAIASIVQYVIALIDFYFGPPPPACVPDECPGSCDAPPLRTCRGGNQPCDFPVCSCGEDGVVTCFVGGPCTCAKGDKGCLFKGGSPCVTCDCFCGSFSVLEPGCQKGTCGFKGACAASAKGRCKGGGGIFKGCKGLKGGPDDERRRLVQDESYDPTPEEALQVAKETGGDPDAAFVLQEGLLTPEECASLVAYMEEHRDTATRYRSDDNDRVIMARDRSPLEGIIGEGRARELYKTFKDITDGAPVTQVWLRAMSGADTFMGLHTDAMPHQMKVNLNADFEDGDTLVVDRDGARRIGLGVGDGYTHGSDLVHGHMPFTGTKYMLYVVSDPEPVRDLAAEVLAA